jgi:hypothetical protein
VSPRGAHSHGAEGFCTVRKYAFRALVALDPWARPNTLLPFLDGTCTQYVVQPCDDKYFPARISIGAPASPGCALDVVVHVPLLAGEAEAFFATGQPLTVWADAIVDDETIHGEGVLGDSVILSHESAALPNASDQEVLRATARLPLSEGRTGPKPNRGHGASPVAERQQPNIGRHGISGCTQNPGPHPADDARG